MKKEKPKIELSKYVLDYIARAKKEFPKKENGKIDWEHPIQDWEFDGREIK